MAGPYDLNFSSDILFVVKGHPDKKMKVRLDKRAIHKGVLDTSYISKAKFKRMAEFFGYEMRDREKFFDDACWQVIEY